MKSSTISSFVTPQLSAILSCPPRGRGCAEHCRDGHRDQRATPQVEAGSLPHAPERVFHTDPQEVATYFWLPRPERWHQGEPQEPFGGGAGILAFDAFVISTPLGFRSVPHRRRRSCHGAARTARAEPSRTGPRPTVRASGGRRQCAGSAGGPMRSFNRARAISRSADRARRASSACASCSPVGATVRSWSNLSDSIAKARPRRASTVEVAARPATSSGAVSTARCRDSVAPSTCRRTASNRDCHRERPCRSIPHHEQVGSPSTLAAAIGCHSCSASRRLRAEANANNRMMMATTRTIAPMIQPQGVELSDAAWLGAVVVVVGPRWSSSWAPRRRSSSAPASWWSWTSVVVVGAPPSWSSRRRTWSADPRRRGPSVVGRRLRRGSRDPDARCGAGRRPVGEVRPVAGPAGGDDPRGAEDQETASAQPPARGAR